MSQTHLFPSNQAFEKHDMKIFYKRKNMHSSCPICLDDFTCTGPLITRMRSIIRHCTHTFHSKYLIDWLEEHATCLMCRAKLFPTMVLVGRRMCEVPRADGQGSEILTFEEVWELGKDLDKGGE
jgi:hypothetical protein